LKGLNGILVPGGFGDRGIEGKIAAVKFARENKIPYLGLCLGLQIAVVEFARNVLGLEKANSYEVDENSPDPVISMMNEQKNIVDKGATMRLGSYECKVKPGTKGFAAYGQEFVRERHRHRYEVNNDYVERLEAAGLTVSGVNPKRDLVEMVELEDHPWFLAVQSHPEFLSKPSKAHPLFQAFVSASLEEKRV
ncbi:MAG: glutamine amidotransferase-related protein, partial [Opitutales bacterium]